MTTRATDSLSEQIRLSGGSAAMLCLAFDDWKAGFPESEFSNVLFGKDGGYSRPTVDGKPYLLRHVHLMPVQDQVGLQRWMTAYKRGHRKQSGSRRTSNRVLVYATRELSSGRLDHLLLFILDEPEAHEIALMKTTENRLLMSQLASCAADFIENGRITA